MEKRYDAVVARKRAKQEELRRTARDKSKVDGMKVIVEEMLRDREHRIEQSMARFSDPHLRPDARSAKDGFLPVIGGPKNLVHRLHTGDEQRVWGVRQGDGAQGAEGLEGRRLSVGQRAAIRS